MPPVLEKTHNSGEIMRVDEEVVLGTEDGCQDALICLGSKGRVFVLLAIK